MRTVHISSRSRNLGYGWTNQPVKQFNSRGESSLVIATPSAPDVTGGPRAVLSEIAHAVRVNSGNWWRGALFVSGKRVLDYDTVQEAREMIDYLDADGVDVSVED